jgi:hypothetical protein
VETRQKAEGKGQTGDESEDRRKKRLQAKRGLSRRIWYKNKKK